jgi:hypothetical protein
MSNKWKDIGTLLLEYGLMTDNDLKEGIKLQKETGLRLGEALVKLGKVSMEDIDWVLSKQLDIPFVIVEDITPNCELLSRFPKEFLIENKILPLYETDEQISIVAEDPLNKPAIAFIEESLSKKVNISTGSGRKIKELLINTFKEIVFPELVSALEDITGRVKKTSFYRIDFLLGEQSCSINIFGFGILKNAATIRGIFSRDDVFTAFNELNIPFLYDHASSGKRDFVITYPLLNRFDLKGLPAVVGEYGLFLYDDISFTDAYAHGLSRFFHFDAPVDGYKYFSTKKNDAEFKDSIYVIDAAPADFRKCYVKISVPEKCPSCGGAGCGECKELGYGFRELEGMYSSNELQENLKRV